MPLIIAGLIAFLAVAVIDLSWNWGAVQAAERPMRVMTLAYGGSALLLVLGAANLQLTSTGIANRAFLFLGEASYSIYLWHEPAQRSLVRVLMHLGLMDPAFRLFAMTAMILIGVVAGLVAWRFIERPLLRSVATWRSRA